LGRTQSKDAGLYDPAASFDYARRTDAGFRLEPALSEVEGMLT
jgi:hypothetical protein